MDKKEKILGFINDDIYTPMKAEEIALLLSVPKEEYDIFSDIINELILEGNIIKTKRGKLVSCKKMGYITCTYRANPKGYGFALQENEEDIFISKNDSWGAMNGDTVVAEVYEKLGEGNLREGRIVRILKRANKTVVGTLYKRSGLFYAEADNEHIWQHIYIKKKNTGGALKGQKVLVKILKYPTDKEKAQGEIISVLGWQESNDTKLLSVMYSFGLESDFPRKVMSEAESIPLSLSEERFIGRTDLRRQTVITIDGEDAKDLDDAVSVTKLENGNYLLSVHIADVSGYVKEGSALDKEALKRGTSVYLPGKTLPMLPPRLSNGICSLTPGSPRLALSVDMEFNNKGELVYHNIYESVISTTERMTYNSVQKIIDGNDGEIKKYKKLVPLIINMRELAGLLRIRREKDGFIDFDFPEAKIDFDDKMNVRGVFKYENTEANGIIEEFMLAANNCVAEHFFRLGVPFIYRVHENPETEKIMALEQLLLYFKIKIKGSLNDIKPKTLSDILKNVKGKPYEAVIAEAMLRSMKKARYSADCIGHFGLSMKYYCHFTSPIRRYPDLIIHRIIKEYIKNGTINEQREKQLIPIVTAAAKQSSEREINAAEAERTAVKIMIAGYMKQYIGYEFTGIVSSFTGFGMFIQLPNLVEGLVRFADIEDDYYSFDENTMTAHGEKSGKKYFIGQTVKVVVAKSNDLNGEIDFALV